MADPYYTIGEVLALLLEEFPDVTISKIRFLESQGLITPERTSAGYRKFTKSEIERLRFILREQKDNFLPLRVIRDRLEGETSESLLRPEDITDPSMPRGIRLPSSGHPTKRVMSDRGVTDDRSVASGSARRPVKMSRADLLEATGIEPHVLDQLQKMKLVRPVVLGTQTFFDEVDRDIVHLAGRFAALGVEPRLLMAWRLAAEREADIIEPLVQSRTTGKVADDEDAHKLMSELVSLAEDLRTALLRSTMRDLLTDS